MILNFGVNQTKVPNDYSLHANCLARKNSMNFKALKLID